MSESRRDERMGRDRQTGDFGFDLWPTCARVATLGRPFAKAHLPQTESQMFLSEPSRRKVLVVIRSCLEHVPVLCNIRRHDNRPTR